ncbi:50S ribosomal protein L25 [Candidatus Shapirobacteria bacterium]|nr:50S ribosomal protein L25 [Candidatus Shapirobacteria bacterium]
MSDKDKQLKLDVEKRKTTGRGVKALRREGLLPANIYGKKVKSLAVQLETKAFLPTFHQAGETGLVELKVVGEITNRPVLIHDVQFHPVTGDPLHADFYQVDLKEKVTAKVPVELIGEAPAVREKIGILIQTLAEVEVEALPGDLPEKIEVNISSLEKVDDGVSVSELKTPSGVKILTEAKEILAKIEPPAKEEVAPPPAEEAPVEEEEVEVAPVEGKETPPQEKPTEEGEKKETPAKGE